MFSVTHLGSGSLQLLSLLNRNPRVQFVQSQPVIQNYIDLRALIDVPHKLNSIAALYAVDINFNYQLGSKYLIPHADYLFVVRQPEPVLNLLVESGLYDSLTAATYYCYRLRRICEIAKRVKSGMLLTFDEIRNGDHIEPLKRFVSLKEDISHEPAVFEKLKPVSKNINKETLDWCSDCYERHLFFLRNIQSLNKSSLSGSSILGI